MIDSKRIMILGATYKAVPLIEASRNEGYYVIVCDRILTNPGIKLADKHYQVSILDKEVIFEICKNERIDGIISNYDYSMPVVAYVSEKMGLIGNTESSIYSIGTKAGLRECQKRLGDKNGNVFSPQYAVSSSFDDIANVENFRFPVIIKPAISSASRGLAVINSYEELKTAIDLWLRASEYSEDNRVVIEEYVSMKDPTEAIEGDVFIHKGEIIWNGLFTDIRSKYATNIPMTDVIPPLFSKSQNLEIRQLLTQLFDAAGIKHGEYNVELFFTDNDELLCVEINARQGGGGIPGLLRKAYGIDYYKLLVTTAMGDDKYFNEVKEISARVESESIFICRHSLFSHKSGLFTDIYIAEAIRPFITNMEIKTDLINTIVCEAGTYLDILGYIDLAFPTRDDQLSFVEKNEELIYPIVI